MIQLLPLLVLCLASTPASQGDLADLSTQARKAGSAEARIAALESIAALQAEGSPPSEAISQALAIGFKDKKASVRQHTANLFGSTQHPEIAVVELAKATTAELNRWKKSCENLLGFQNSAEGKKLSRRHEKAANEGSGAAERIAEDYNKRVQVFREAINTNGAVLDDLAAQLGSWRDDRSVSALAVVLKECSGGKLAESEGWFFSIQPAVPAIDALLSLGSAKSVEAVISSLKNRKKAAKAAEAAHKKFASKPDKYPDWHVANARSRFEGLKAHSAVITEKLQEFAKKNKLPRAPGTLGTAGAWRSWSTQVRTKLPKTLGRIAVAAE